MSERVYFQPVIEFPDGHHRLAGGWASFTQVDVLRRNQPVERLPLDAVQALWPDHAETLNNLTRPRMPLAGLDLSHPRIMGIVNVTPDSFSDGGNLLRPEQAIAHAQGLAAAGADILDVGGESTRPGAEPVTEAEELDRVLPVIEGIVRTCAQPVSIDTRNAGVAKAALAAGASIVNDVSAMTHDDAMQATVAESQAVCLMHALGDPRTMQDDPRYDDVLLDIYDFLNARLAAAVDAGIPRDRVMIDPGIGFGKTLEHNVRLIRGTGLLHGTGAAILLGVSRKGFIGRLSGQEQADRRAPGSIAAGLAGVGQGVQVLRVHDVDETVQALRVWQAMSEVRR